MALIEVDHVTKQYVKVAKIGVVKKKRTLFTAVDDISFAIEAGEKVGIVGLNGSGKSTLIKMMLGILRADDGTLATFSGDPTNIGSEMRNALASCSGSAVSLGGISRFMIRFY